MKPKMVEIDVQCHYPFLWQLVQERLSGKTCSSVREHPGTTCAKNTNMPQSNIALAQRTGSVQPHPLQIETRGFMATFVFTVLLNGELDQMMFLRSLKWRPKLSSPYRQTSSSKKSTPQDLQSQCCETVSYSLNNVKSSISRHNHHLLTTTSTTAKPCQCNCKKTNVCPLDGKCLTSNIVYELKQRCMYVCMYVAFI